MYWFSLGIEFELNDSKSVERKLIPVRVRAKQTMRDKDIAGRIVIERALEVFRLHSKGAE
jgi:hypothetical protein